MPSHVILTTVTDQPGMLSALTQVLARHDANIAHVDIVRRGERDAEIYFEFSCEGPIDAVVAGPGHSLAALLRGRSAGLRPGLGDRGRLAHRIYNC